MNEVVTRMKPGASGDLVKEEKGSRRREFSHREKAQRDPYYL